MKNYAVIAVLCCDTLYYSRVHHPTDDMLSYLQKYSDFYAALGLVQLGDLDTLGADGPHMYWAVKRGCHDAGRVETRVVRDIGTGQDAVEALNALEPNACAMYLHASGWDEWLCLYQPSTRPCARGSRTWPFLFVNSKL